MSESTDRIRQFSNGTDFCCWSSENCDQCSKYDQQAPDGSILCEIDQAILDAAAGIEGGTISREIATRMGMDERGNFHKCLEFEQATGWYVVGEYQGAKGLLLGSYPSKENAEEAAATVLKKCFERLKSDNVTVNVPFNEVNIMIEQLPTKAEGQLNIVLYHVQRAEKKEEA